MKNKYAYLLISIVSLPIIIFAVDKIQQLQSEAAPKSANIVINTQEITGKINYSWAAISQGGEEPPPMLKTAVPKIQELTPKYIRIDHIYDYYDIVRKQDGKYYYDFSKLDDTVEDIIKTGALPFFSLSYMPSSFTLSGSVIDTPTDWDNWKELIRETIAHYSGKLNRNLVNVYYEVWNEPELPQFGSWKLDPSKDYRLLYYYSVKGAQEVNNVNQFFIGGPAIGSYYPTWISSFLTYVTQNKLRLDFYSWHRYNKKAAIFSEDARNTRQILEQFPDYAKIPLVISEWGIESENDPINNSNLAAAFTISAISKFHDLLKYAFVFEAKDGPPPNGGKWGLITHEKSEKPLDPKPRFDAFLLLSKLKGDKLSLIGEGTYVNAIAAKNGDNIMILLSNYDLSNKNIENVPISFKGLKPASYSLKYNYILDQMTGTYDLVTTDGNLDKSFLMTPNSILLLELNISSPLATFIPGRSGNTNDKALQLSVNTPFILTSPEFRLTPQSSIDFDIKPLWENEDFMTFIIFDAPFSTENGIINRLFLLKQKNEEGNRLVFGILENQKDEISVSTSINQWQKDTWHHVNLGWDQNGLYISVDNEPTTRKGAIVNVYNGKILTFYPVASALDNLEINLSEQQLIKRTFDGNLER